LAYRSDRWDDKKVIEKRYGIEVVALDRTVVFPWLACDLPDGTRVIAVQGTHDLGHWRPNLDVGTTPIVAGHNVRVHKGARVCAAQSLEKIAPLLPYKRVAFVGHSMGGAIAQIVLAMAVLEGIIGPGDVDRTTTFGVPAVFRGNVRELCIPDCHVFDVVTQGDPVPMCLSSLGFRFLSDQRCILPSVRPIVPTPSAHSLSRYAAALKQIRNRRP
jgi:hypothetical protein